MCLGFIKKIYQKTHTLFIFTKSLVGSRILRLKTHKRSYYDAIKGKIIILMPHSDDEWIGCSQIMMDQSAKVLIVNMDMMGGDKEDVHYIRRQEMLIMAKKHNSKVVLISGEKADKIKKLSLIIKDINPDYVCVPFYYDWHVEHLEAREILFKALRFLWIDRAFNDVNKLNIIEYQISVPIPMNYVTHCLKMTHHEQTIKWELFGKIYKSQAFLPVWRFKNNEYVSGKLCEEYACERFVCSTVGQWMSSYKDNTISEQQRLIIMKDFRDIFKICTTLEKFDEKKRQLAMEK